jgi:spermidine synthase
VACERILKSYTGVALPCAALVLACNMAGLCLGALAAFWLEGRYKRTIALYAGSQLFISAYIGASVFAQGSLDGVLQSISTTSFALAPWILSCRLAASVAFLMPVVCCMGASFVFLASHLTNHGNSGILPKLYCLNLLGAASGAAVAGFFLIPCFDVTLTVAVSALASGLAAVVVAPLLAGSLTEAYGIPPDESIAPSDLKIMPLTLIATGCGALSMVLQITWMRLSMLIFASSIYAFSIVLTSQLLGLALGGYFVAIAKVAIVKGANVSNPSNQGQFEWQHTLKLVSVLLLVVSISLLSGLIFFNELPLGVYNLQQILLQICPSLPWAPLFSFIISRALITFAFALIPSLSLGGVLPALFAIAASGNQSPAAFGRLYVSNTLGAIFGVVLAGFFLVPLLNRLWVSGIQLSLIFSAWFALAMASYLAWRIKSIKAKRLAIAGALTCFALLLCVPAWDIPMLCSGVSFVANSPNGPLTVPQFQALIGADMGEHKAGCVENLFYREGLNATVNVGRVSRNNTLFLKTDGKMEACLPENPHLPAPSSDETTQVLLGILPILLSPLPARDVFLIGLGSGVTAGAVLDSGDVRKLVVAELEEDVKKALPLFAKSIAHADEILSAPPASSRYEQISLDGRNLLSLCDRQYDVIISQPGEPWLEGSANLYTVEFWRLARRRLRDKGVFCQWIQLYAVDKSNLARLCRSFQLVFPETLVFRSRGAGEILLIGFKGDGPETGNQNASASIAPPAIGPINWQTVKQRFAQEIVNKHLAHLGFACPIDLLSSLILTPESLATLTQGQPSSSDESPFNVDAHPLAEFRFPATLLAAQINPEASEKFQAQPFEFSRVYCNFGASPKDTAQLIARFALSYLESDCASGKVVCRELLRQAQALDQNAALESAEALLMLDEHRVIPAFLRQRLIDASNLQHLDCNTAVLTARFFDQEKAWGPARRCLQAALRDQPFNWQCQLALGEVALKSGDAAFALACFQKVIEAKPNCWQAWQQAGAASAKLADYVAAVRYLKQALQVYPGQFEARFLLGKILCNSGHALEGLNEIVWASRQQPENAQPNLYVTAYYVAKLQWDEAAKNWLLLKAKLAKDPRRNPETDAQAAQLATKIERHVGGGAGDPELIKILSVN